MKSDTVVWLMPDGIAEEASGARSPMAHVKPLTILLADDYEANRMVQQAEVEQLGYQADAVANGEEVLRAMHARSYDVDMLDIHMPVMNGLETARRIRGRGGNSQPFIVAVTGATLSRDRERIGNAGIDATIEKPVELRELAGVLGDAYERKHGGAAVPGAEDCNKTDSVRLDLGPLQAQLGPAAATLLRRVIPVYLRELPERETRLRAALGSKDAEAFGRLFHGLKGASRVVGATELATMCERLEQDAYAGNLPDATVIDELLDLARRTATELRRKLTTLDP